jgi:hypothetical protein
MLLAHNDYNKMFEYDRDNWRCPQCALGYHECFLCCKEGYEDRDVFRCQRMCGKYYHLACVTSHERTMMLPDKKDIASIATAELVNPINDVARPSTRFVCPFHLCATCTQPFDPFHPNTYKRCHMCPTAYHVNVSEHLAAMHIEGAAISAAISLCVAFRVNDNGRFFCSAPSLAWRTKCVKS